MTRRGATTRASLCVLVAALFQLWPLAARAVTPSPTDWRDVMIYQLLTDRFWDGNPANNSAENSYVPATGNRTHGGDFQGLEQKLDYLQALGVGAVWISPVVLNAFGEYHGYAARDFYSISSQMGGLAALQSFIAAAHARGIYVVLDVVLNHMGDMIDSGTSGYPGYRANPSPYVLRYRLSTPRPAPPFNNLAWFHNNGHIGNFNDPEQILGELASLDDLKTEIQPVRDALVAATNWLIDQTDCDGFRIDTVKHTEIGFWQDWAPRVQAHCAAIGKSNFLMFGEVFDGSDAKNGFYTGTVAGGAYALNSMLYYPMYYSMQDVFIWGQPTSRLTDRYDQLTQYDPTVRGTLVQFLDNHDNGRFLEFGKANQDSTKLRPCIDWLLTSQEIPCLYYGTEHLFDGGGDPWCREDMWDGQWDYGPSDGDNFNMTHPFYLRVQRLNNLRRLYPALTRGTQTRLQHDTAGPGLYVFSRQLGGAEVVVALNTATVSRTTNMLATSFGAGVAVMDLNDTTAVLATNGAGQVSVTVPPRASRILVPRLGPLRLDPHVLACSPKHDARTVPSLTPIVLTFNEPMDTLSVMQNFDLTPPLFGRFSWSANRRVMTYVPLAPMTVGTGYEIRVDAAARDAGGRPLRAAFSSIFRVGAGTAPAVTVPAGYRVEVFAESGVGAPEGLAFGPGSGGWTSDLFVGDETQDRILRVTPTGQVSTHAASTSLCRKPEALAFDRGGLYGGALLSADDAQYVKITSAGATAAFGGAAPAARTGTLVQAPAGPFGGLCYTSSVDTDQVYRLGVGGALTTFATGLRGVEGLAFGPGGAWGSDLYLADASLTGLSAAINGDAAIYRLDSAGVRTLVVQDSGLLSGAAALAFDTVGHFDGDLFVSDVLNERLLRVTPTGEVSVFATGFGNLFASGGLVFGPDGALYVADTGSGQPFGDGSGGSAVGRILRIVRFDTTGTPVDPTLRLRLRAAPNPCVSSVQLNFVVPVPLPAEVEVFDVRGRRMAVLLRDEVGSAGSRAVDWDLRDGNGRTLPAGVYWARLTVGALSETVRLVVSN